MVGWKRSILHTKEKVRALPSKSGVADDVWNAGVVAVVT